jgi:2-polyprenyl-6-methoxyphenol hydroxylase-like FAD-dependent oxidoreductase
VLLRTPDHWRVLLPTPPDTPDELELGRLGERLRAVADPGRPWRVAHASIYRVHQRVAGGFRAGRALLAGDAAHVNNPLGGLGMNSGIHDAIAYAGALPAALAGDEAPLDLPPSAGGSRWSTCRACRTRTTSGCAPTTRSSGRRTWPASGSWPPTRPRRGPTCCEAR